MAGKHSPGGTVVSTHTPELFQAAVCRAAELLRQGEVVALPTETVYGLAANALSAEAVAKIYRMKGRPSHNPTIVHVASEEMAMSCVASWPAEATQLARAFWPGPLTLVLARGIAIPDVVTAGGATVGVRWPSHPFIQALIRECGFPLAAPSANPSNRTSPTDAQHVARYFGPVIPLVVDGGPCQVGIESTVLDLTTTPARILRPGMVQAQAIRSVLPVVAEQETDSRPASVLRSPGQLRQHYAPRAKLVVCSWQNDHELRKYANKHAAPSETVVVCHTRIPAAGEFLGVSVVPHDPEAFARALYAELHRCDQAGARLILLEAPPEGIAWEAVRDRLLRASATIGS
jgi:L-threonylcarbamoyladenylate synthase